jgi:hypothetical protein
MNSPDVTAGSASIVALASPTVAPLSRTMPAGASRVGPRRSTAAVRDVG